MQANELRIGNLVEVDLFKQVSIWAIHQNEVFISTSKGGTLNMPLSEIRPTPLTEEWLMKIGFEIINANHHVYIIQARGKYFDVIKHREDIKFDNGYPRPEGFEIQFHTYYSDVNFDKFYYVHQLQNLYFALTGEELEIKK